MPQSHPSHFSPCLLPRVSSLCLFVTIYLSLFLVAAIVLFSSLFQVRSVRDRHVSSQPSSHIENDYGAEVRRSESGRYYYHLQRSEDENQWENRLATNESGYVSPLKYIQSITDSLGLRWPYSQSEINCSSFQEISGLEFVASGWTKAVYKGRFRGQDIAVKTVNLNGHDIQECRKRGGATVATCHRRAAAKILKEIILLTELTHRNIVKVLGSCVLDSGPIAIITELGEPLDTVKLLQLSWEDRLRLALGIAEILHHLAHSPLGSLSMNDFRRQQFVLVNGTLKLSDVDDLGIKEPECDTHNECTVRRNLSVKTKDEPGVECINARCRGYNEQLNIWHAGQHFIHLFLPIRAPASLAVRVNELLAAYEQRGSNTRQILSTTKQLVELYKSGQYVPRTHRLQASHLGFNKVPNSDLPGMFDYRCNDSISSVSCVKSVFNEMEAAQICAQDPHCVAVVLGQERTWTGRTIAVFKNGYAMPSKKPGYSLLKKSVS